MAEVANPTFIELVNNGLVQCGYAPIETAAFADDDKLEAPQLRAKVFFNECCAKLALEFDSLFARRMFQLDSATGVFVYPVDPATNIESIMYHSFRCNTAGKPQLVAHMDYEEFRDRYPDNDTATRASGTPTTWTYKAQGVGESTNRTNQIILYPTPDEPLIYEYAAKLVWTPLVDATDKVIWPQEYRHTLTANLRKMLERRAKTDDYSDYTTEIEQQVKQQARGPNENKIRTRNEARTGRRFTSGQGILGSKYL